MISESMTENMIYHWVIIQPGFAGTRVVMCPQDILPLTYTDTYSDVTCDLRKRFIATAASAEL